MILVSQAGAVLVAAPAFLLVTTMYNPLRYIPRTLEVLGTDEGGAIIVWAKDNRRLFRIQDIDALRGARIIQMAGADAAHEIGDFINKDDDDGVVAAIRDAIADASRQRYFHNSDSLGQGIWRCPGGDGMLLVTGAHAYRIINDHADTHLCPLESPLVGSTLLDLTGREWLNVDDLLFAIDGQTADDLRAVCTRLIDILGQWQFKHDQDRMLIVGLMIATGIQSYLQFRPHVWLTGAAFSGKTALITLLRRCWPFMRVVEGRTSEAAIRQAINVNALPVALDEQEPWWGQSAVLELMRSSNRGGTILKGSASGRSVEYRVNHLIWFASIDVSLTKEADKTRFVVVELLRSDKKIEIPAADDLAFLGLHLLAGAIVNAEVITETFDRLVAMEEFSRYGRFREVYAVPVAAYCTFMGMDFEQTAQMLGEVLTHKHQDMEGQMVNDEQDLIDTILMIPLPGEGSTTVGDVLGRPGKYESVYRAFEQAGIRRLPGDRVFIYPKLLKSHMPDDPKWKTVDIGVLLERLPGAQRTKQRIDSVGKNVRGVSIPIATFGAEPISLAEQVMRAAVNKDEDEQMRAMGEIKALIQRELKNQPSFKLRRVKDAAKKVKATIQSGMFAGSDDDQAHGGQDNDGQGNDGQGNEEEERAKLMISPRGPDYIPPGYQRVAKQVNEGMDELLAQINEVQEG